MGRVRVSSRIIPWSAKTERNLDIGMLDLATVIHRDAGNLAPRDTGALIASGRIRKNGVGNYSIVFGGGSVPYAKRRHYENRKHPGTLNYLKRAGDANSKQIKQYLKGI